MKKLLILTAIFCLLFQAVSVSAATPDFSGLWTLDKTRSVLPEMMRIETMTLNVSQTQKELKVESATTRTQGELSGNGVGSGKMGGGGMGGGGTQTMIYSLDGKETTAELGKDLTTGKETKTASMTADGKLSLTLIRNLDSQMGSVMLKTNDTWELLDEGKTLKITRYSETPRGATNAILYFTKKSEGITPVGTTNSATVKDANGNAAIPRQISGGVLNGKAVTLVKPEYPAAAKAVNASGAVNVQVTIDEQGNIISASAVSGHPLLRQAAEEAARNSKFAPTLLQGVPVKITGIIVYNFAP